MMTDDTPHPEDGAGPPPQTMTHMVKRRLAGIAIGLAAHACRLLALAPILGAPVIAIMAAGSLTGNEERLAPLLERFLPHELQSFSGGLMEFGLPIARKYVYLGFWILLPLTVVEEITGWRVATRISRPRYWSLALISVFAILTLFEIFFHNVNGGFLKATSILCFVNGFLCVSAIIGVGALFLVNVVEKILIDSVRGSRGH